jgi:AcrR family transcriptional regulator
VSEIPIRGVSARGSRKPRSDGERSRKAILQQAAQLATVEGIDGLSIGRLAEAVGMSKSGLFAHFGSKEELQLATIEAANEVFTEHVVAPAASAPTAFERLRRLTEGFLKHVQDDVFLGGCFFASVVAEMDMQPGPVRDLAIKRVDEWFESLVETGREAQEDGTIDPAEDPRQLAFELDAFMLMANFQYVAHRDRDAIERARRALDRRLALAAAS